jgi:putative ABC transport system substrate-binding protein
VRRHEFITLLGGTATAWPLAALAQQAAKVWRIGFIGGTTFIPSLFSGFLEGMRDLGYTEGKDFAMEWRFPEGYYERYHDLATDLVRMKVDVIVLSAPRRYGPRSRRHVLSLSSWAFQSIRSYA